MVSNVGALRPVHRSQLQTLSPSPPPLDGVQRDSELPSDGSLRSSPTNHFDHQPALLLGGFSSVPFTGSRPLDPLQTTPIRRHAPDPHPLTLGHTRYSQAARRNQLVDARFNGL